ncbi:hypothetical protein BDB01DRAFT_712764 [Pilobolus umbonatus]|nr:hypothetical protein BDB01DRAFT_712764 [Pilobolus umbonatus]
MSDLFYCQNPEWADITPLSQDDGPNPLVPIAYSAEFLELIKDIIEMNPAHYTVWNYRQQVLFAINADLDRELDYIDELIEDQKKNYQIWHHRQVIVDRLNKGARELAFIDGVLDVDSKNYHAWSYRQWVVKRFNLWDNEIAYTTDLIVFDIRNNSAWNYRFYTLFNNTEMPSAEVVEGEIKLLEKTHRPLSTVEPFLNDLAAKKIQSPFLLSMYIDIYEEKARTSKSPISNAALEMCQELAVNQDSIRDKYWQYRKHQLHKLNV